MMEDFDGPLASHFYSQLFHTRIPKRLPSKAEDI